MRRPTRPPASRHDDGVSLVELVVASVVFLAVMAVTGPLIVRMVTAQSTLRQRDAQVTTSNDVLEQTLAFGCGQTVRTAGSSAERTTVLTRATSCAGLLAAVGAGTPTEQPFGTVTVSSGDLRSSVTNGAGTTSLEIRSAWTDPLLTRNAWIPVADGSVAATVIANAPRTPSLVLQRTITVTVPIDGQPRTQTLNHLAARVETEIPVGAVGRLDVVTPAGFDKVAVQFLTIGTGAVPDDPVWMVRQTLNLDDQSTAATLLTGGTRRVASFPFVPAGSYTVKAIRLADGTETTLRTCEVANTGDPATGGDINVCYV
jgi:hypothetical protein